MFGSIELEKFDRLSKMPQEAASAWCALDGLVGASYKPLLYLGKQVVRGTLYYFIAERTLITATPIRHVSHVIKLAILSVNGQYELVGESVETIL